MVLTSLLDIAFLPYSKALDLMRGLVEAKRDPDFSEVLILVEHEPVLTMGRRAEETHVQASNDCLRHQGISIHRVERGGLITYHGPGQLVAYPIFNIRKMRLGITELVSGLEEVVLRTLADYAISGRRRPEYRGVWIGEEKIASVGIAVRHGVTFHGIAMNYSPDLSHFDLIIPCGISGVRMTSLERLIGRKVDPQQIRECVIQHFRDVFSLKFQPWTLEQALETLSRCAAAFSVKEGHQQK